MLITLALLITIASSQCAHPIFCNSQILQAAADSGLFSDSKTFVDLTLRAPVEEVLQKFKTQNRTAFFKQNFHGDPNLLLTPAIFNDYQESPEILSKIQDLQLRKFASELNKRWNMLGKKVELTKAETIGTCKKNCSTFLPDIDNFTILVPGGRFRESYYWDTYWIVLGLLACDMIRTAQMLLDNFASVIQRHGLIPNGFREYFLTRSQPPYLFMMVQAVTKYHVSKGQPQRAEQLQKRMYGILLEEHDYWQRAHLRTVYISGQLFNVKQYRAQTKNPRPQSYKQDVSTISKLVDPAQKERVLQGLSSMAESGWDFSSRWLKSDSLQSTKIDSIIPSDLNALLGMMEKYIADLSIKYGFKELYPVEMRMYEQKVKYFKAIKANGRFPDYHLDTPSIRSGKIYPTDFMPFLLLEEKVSVSAIYLDTVNPRSSFVNTGQQWDEPNVWAPNNWIIHEVSPSIEAREYATQWVSTTYCGYIKHGSLFQKYLNSKLGSRGEGGEYESQIGFGWTNGLALHYLSLYPDMKRPNCQ